MFLSTFSFSVMGALVKFVSPSVSEGYLLFFRSFVNFVIIAIIMVRRGETFWPEKRGLLVLRGIIGTTGLSVWFYVIEILPLTVIGILNLMSYIFVLLLARVFLKERVSRETFAWMCVATAGFMMIISESWSADALIEVDPAALALGLIACICSAGAAVTVRAATATFKPNVVIAYFTGMASLASIPWIAVEDRIELSPIPLAALLMIGVAATFGQIGMTYGYKAARAGIVSTMNLLGTGFSLLWGYLFFQERISATQFVGVIVVGAGIYLMTVRSSRASAKTILVK